MRFQNLSTVLCSFILLFSATLAYGQSFPFKTAILTLNVTEVEGENTTLSRSKMWIDYEQRRFSIETDVILDEGDHAKFVTIHMGAEVYILNMDEKTVQQIQSSGQDIVPFEFGGLPEYSRFGGTHVGTDTIAGHVTDIYEYIKFEDVLEPVLSGQDADPSDDAEGELDRIMARSGRQSRVKQWVWSGIDFSLKTVVDYGSKMITTETIQIVTDIDLPPRVFTIPEGFTVTKPR